MRLDVFLTEGDYAESRTEAKNFIVSGAVTVDGKIITKPAFDVQVSMSVSVDRAFKKYVSRGGLKLEGALKEFGISAEGKIALDVGASSGGFTDCLLKHGAIKVISVDSGSGQIVKSLRDDERVLVYENYNARYMSRSDFPLVPTLAVMDVSFISATYIIPAVYDVLPVGSDFICLIKPQFEVGKGALGKGGIVKDENARRVALKKVTDFSVSLGFKAVAHTLSPIKGGDGNIEYLAHFKK